VRGNGKIIQELEAVFTGAGWNVIKVIWARDWDPLSRRTTTALLVEAMNETVDGEWQTLCGRDRALHPRARSSARSAAAQDGRAPERRGHPAPAPRRPRLPQGVRGVRLRDRAPPASRP
jgi:hypothetical protein